MKDKSNDNELDQIFDEDKLDRAIKKGKRKPTKRTVFISSLVTILVFVLIAAGSIALNNNMCNKTFQTMNAYSKLTVPNGYISKSVDTFGFLGGNSNYTISRMVGNKPVILEERVQSFGLLPQIINTSGQGGYNGQISGEWPKSYWEYGYNKMIFFHPQIAYKEYKNDLADLNQIGNDKLIEVGLSFDKPYTISKLSNILPDVKISWYWVDTFTNEDMERYNKRVKDYNTKTGYINEFDVLGVGMMASPDVNHFGSNYYNFIYNLKTSINPKHNGIYKELEAKGYSDSSKVPILGAIVCGTKSELRTLIGNPHIKASSFSVITEKY